MYANLKITSQNFMSTQIAVKTNYNHKTREGEREITRETGNILRDPSGIRRCFTIECRDYLPCNMCLSTGHHRGNAGSYRTSLIFKSNTASCLLVISY